jgi:hypothetical protein
MILQLYGELLMEELSLLLVHVNVVCSVLHEVVELLAVLMDGVVPLSQVEELYQLTMHKAHREVTATKGDAELTP